MAEYRHSGHAVCDLKYHLMWITKYRYKILRGEVAERARDLGSPPKFAMLSRTHSSAATMSNMPTLPESTNSSPPMPARLQAASSHR
jgi:hypothetical protein